MIKDYIKQAKRFKYWSKEIKRLFIADILRSLIFLLLGVGLYLWLKETGLMLYLIFMLKYHWAQEGK